jgi:hypothetical protein
MTLSIKHAALSTTAVNANAGVKLIKLIWLEFTHTFCNIDHFIRIINICLLQRKDLAYKKE